MPGGSSISWTQSGAHRFLLPRSTRPSEPCLAFVWMETPLISSFERKKKKKLPDSRTLLAAEGECKVKPSSKNKSASGGPFLLCTQAVGVFGFLLLVVFRFSFCNLYIDLNIHIHQRPGFWTPEVCLDGGTLLTLLICYLFFHTLATDSLLVILTCLVSMDS